MKRYIVGTLLFLSALQLAAAPAMRPSRSSASAPASLFWKFGGNGADGWHTVTGNEILNDITRQYANLTIPEGTTLTLNNTFAYIAVQGTCTIDGTIDADGRGAPGTETSYDNYEKEFLPPSALNAERIVGAAPVGSCVTGAGGGGFVTGGGAGSHGGLGTFAPFSDNGKPTPIQKIIGLSGGSSGNNDGKTLTDDFGPLVAFGGAAGGIGYPISPPGGNGGGVIYIECGTLVFTGTLTANGTNGSGFDVTNVGGGGGGGGSILVRAQHILCKTGKVSVNGGLGGHGASRNGGNGAPGFVDIVNMQ